MNNESNSEPTIIVGEYHAAANKISDQQSYKGLAIHALPGLHEFIFERVKELTPRGGKILDLAAGSGAMALRARDDGFIVTATDYVSENFKLHGSINFFKVDLNSNFSKDHEESYNTIIATEIIEHIENPRHFARQCQKLLKTNGSIVFSTPNVDSVASIVSHIRGGTYQWFSDSDYQHDGHITPLMQWQIDKCFKEAGFIFTYKGSFGDRNERLAGSPRLMLLAKFINIVTTLEDGLKGQIFVATARKI
jgi:SAM-dependent methyltransferase